MGCVGERGQGPLQFYWLRAAAKFLTLYSAGKVACSRRLCLQTFLSASYKKCWTGEFAEACEGLRASDRYTDCVTAAIPLPLQDFAVDLHERLRAVWMATGWRRP